MRARPLSLIALLVVAGGVNQSVSALEAAIDESTVQDSTQSAVHSTHNDLPDAGEKVPLVAVGTTAIPDVAPVSAAKEGATLVAAANSPQSERTVEALSREIIRKEMDLQKLNTNLKLHQLPKPWANRRWAFINLANVSLTATGAFINGIGRYQYLSDAARAPKALFEHAAWCRVTANLIAVSGAMFESSMLALGDYFDRRHGFDMPTMRSFADHLQNDIDALLVQRSALVAAANASAYERQVLESEGVILKDVRNLLVNEFARYYADAKGNKAQTYIGYFMAATSNAIAASGGITGNAAAALKHRSARYKIRLVGYGGIADIIAGGMNQSVPLVTRLGGAVVRNHAKKSVAQQLDTLEPAQLDALHDHQQRFHDLISTGTSGAGNDIVLKDDLFKKQVALFDEHEKLRIGDQRASRRKLVDQLIFFSGIGGPKLTNGVGITVGHFKYTNNVRARFKSIGGPAIAYGAGYCVAAAELLRYQTLNEIRNHKQKKAGTSQGQVLRKEIQQLDLMESELDKVGSGG